MPIDEILRNSAPAIGAVLISVIALICVRRGRTAAENPRNEVGPTRTTLVLDDQLVAKAGSYTGLTDISEIVREALKALIEREAARRLALLGGTEPDLVAPPRRR